MSIPTTTIISICSVLVAFVSLIFTIITLNHNKHKDVKSETKENVEIHAGLQSQIDTLKTINVSRLDAIDNGIRDLKADNRGFRSELTKMRDDLHEEMRGINDKAVHATELAEAAHRRLDRIGAAEDNIVAHK